MTDNRPSDILDDAETIRDPEHQPVEASAGPSLAGYRILRVLGQGGMGTVYEAEQERPRRRVALKVIRAGLASARVLRRFEIEAEALGRLHHPGIAQVYEVGTADTGSGEQPFFAMELVEGQTLLRHAQSRDLNLEQRVELMARICAAVHHAHQKGVIHRDLKPSNILVDEEGRPKILDFGVARVTDSDLKATVQTNVGEILGTLQYMSPEQVAGNPEELDTRSDVYALGVVLYQLLSGKLPQDLGGRSLIEAARIIQEHEPMTLGSVDRSLRGDPDTIVAKALEKEKERRYQSVGELQADLERFLREEPIAARPPSSMYQLQKFARRNRVLVGGVAATVLALIAGIVAAGNFAVREARERERAEVAAASAQRVTDFMVELFEKADPGDRNVDEISVREVLDAGADSARTELDDEPLVKARVLDAIGASFHGLSAFEEAIDLLSESADLQRSAGTSDPIGLARTLSRLAVALTGPESDSANARAQQLRLEIIDTLEPLLEDPSQRKDAAHLIGTAYNGIGSETIFGEMDLEKGVEAHKEAIRYNEMAHGRYGDQNVAFSYMNVGVAYLIHDRPADGVPWFEEALEISEQVVGKEHRSHTLIEMNFADALVQIGEYERAEPMVERAMANMERVLGRTHIRLTFGRRLQGQLAFRRGDLEAAQSYIEESSRIATEVVGPHSRIIAFDKTYLGDMMQVAGREAEAERYYREALELIGATPEPGDDIRQLLADDGIEMARVFREAQGD